MISVVTPAHNAAPFLKETYQSLLQQTYTDWEWVVVDDGSNDETLTLLREMAHEDCRVRVFTMERCSGAAKMPRDRAVYESRGDRLLVLDADDTLDRSYIEQMVQRMQETEADIVYPQMIFTDSSLAPTGKRLPADDFDITKTYDGRDLIRETLPDWRIGCTGGLYRRHVWVNMCYPEKKEAVLMNSDEIDERLYLLEAKRVAFATPEYYYRQHEESITAAVSIKRFHPLKTAIQLLNIIDAQFGRGSEEYHCAQLYLLSQWRNLAKLYMQQHGQLTSADGAPMQSLKVAFCHIERSHISLADRIKFADFRSHSLAMILFALRYNWQLLADKVTMRFLPRTRLRRMLAKRIRQNTLRELSTFYNNDNAKLPDAQTAICLYCGNTSHRGGLIDRLRGAISVYQVCQRVGCSFRLHFTHPFALSDFLEANKYDWTIEPHEIYRNRKYVDIIVEETIYDDEEERQEQQKAFCKTISKNNGHQKHFYTNAAFCYDALFGNNFNTLFKPTPRLQRHLDEIKADIGDKYISVSARFLNLLDDFNEENYSEPLLPEEQTRLIENCLRQTELIHDHHKDCKVLVCSDSITFLNRAAKLPYVYIIKGVPTHIDNDMPHSYEHYEKTFLDLYTISGAEHVYLIKTGEMARSGFPYAASLIGCRPFSLVEF